MRMRRTYKLISAFVILLLVGATTGHGIGWLAPEDRIEDAEFWRMFSEFSEPSGFFPSDNLVSNELTFPALMPTIARLSTTKSVYVGVGPEQNFSYIAALRPRVAFIVDIRRQNAILHLLYKALFEMSPTRGAFLSRLLSRPIPAGLATDASVEDLFDAFEVAAPSPASFEANLRDVRTLLTKTRRFPLNEEDLAALTYVYTAFFEEGPDLQYSFGSSRRGRPFPTLAQLMTAEDDRGIPGSFLATEERYDAIRDMQRRNLIVPVVGNFAGGRGLRSVAAYLKERALTLSVLYTSNVEQYLFRTEDWPAFYANVAGFPVTRDSVLVRSIFNRFNFDANFAPTGPPTWPFRRGTLHLDPIEALNSAVQRGEVTGYEHILARSK